MSDAVQVHSVADGPADGPVVVFSGSLGSDHRMWEPQVKPLTDRGFRVLRYDTRGHGASPVPPGPYTLEDLGGDLLALLDEHGVERAHFVGLSLGGMTGMWLGVNAPDRVESLVLCCTSAKLGPPEMWADRAKTVREKGTGAVAEAGVGRWVTPGFAAAHPDKVAYLREMIAAVPAEGYAAACRPIERMDLVGDLPKISARTLVIAGAEDPATPVEHAEVIADGIPGARLETVEGAAHLGNFEQPERFTALILDHLEVAR
ncbi:3-oxoadipate enol-lactonase [Amycolatopsis regifaucium]|uniref:3-oxoadipate enol-lactonase n=1 Tax=Amycolatopsis regifaucium TaxID=546365 RepID=A0A154M9S4_9PSEU|nr:3-oxoadipate enol-lactonase [Amycolatopsis regifaucium]KZB81345.1 3-oxoadipate enol-lactonase [Amycolatopsis regifaucium]OKA04610.1 3-oxoadipate enol-lactonase [Amycolatopsis regifaucium]SFH33969.1 3-oxoadipate enol-lactonase [Amycolatopsis regifaucium]